MHTYIIPPINLIPLSVFLTHTNKQTNKHFAPSYYGRVIVLYEATEPLEEEINLQQSQFKWQCLGNWDWRGTKTNVAAAWRHLFASRTVWRAMYPKLVHVVTPGQPPLCLSQAVDSRQLDKVANSGASKYGSVNHQIWLPLSLSPSNVRSMRTLYAHKHPPKQTGCHTPGDPSEYYSRAGCYESIRSVCTFKSE